MASYPSTIVSFPARADGQTIFAQHLNLVQEELAAISAGLLTTLGTTNANIRIRRDGNAIEFGHANPAGYGNALGGHGNGKGFLAFNAEAGTTGTTYKTRGVPGAVIEGNNGGGVEIGTVPNANADNQAPTPMLSVGPAGIVAHVPLNVNGGVPGTLSVGGLQVNGPAVVTGQTTLAGLTASGATIGGTQLNSNNTATPGQVAAGSLNVTGAAVVASLAATGNISADAALTAYSGEVYGGAGLRERGRTTKVGEWISPAFNAAWFTGSGGMTWTVGAGGFTVYTYTVIGKTVIFMFDITGTIGGAVNVQASMALPFGTAARAGITTVWTSNGTNAAAMAALTAGAGVLTLYRDATLGVNFNAGNYRSAGTVVYQIP